MADGNNIEIELVKLADGARLLRFTEPKSGLTLERKLDPKRSVTAQKQQLARVFEVTLVKAEATFA